MSKTSKPNNGWYVIKIRIENPAYNFDKINFEKYIEVKTVAYYLQNENKFYTFVETIGGFSKELFASKESIAFDSVLEYVPVEL